MSQRLPKPYPDGEADEDDFAKAIGSILRSSGYTFDGPEDEGPNDEDDDESPYLDAN